jgi:hypothetical protein
MSVEGGWVARFWVGVLMAGWGSIVGGWVGGVGLGAYRVYGMSNTNGSDIGGSDANGVSTMGWVGGLDQGWIASGLGGEIPMYTANRGVSKIIPPSLAKTMRFIFF